MIQEFQKLDIDLQAIEQLLDLSIPENKMMLVFYLAAPEVENDRRSMNVKRPSVNTAKNELPLRGYLLCRICGSPLTGSASKGGLLLDDQLSSDDYQQIKIREEETIDRLIKQNASGLRNEDYSKYLDVSVNLIRDMECSIP